MNNKKRKYFYITASFTETSNENMRVAEIPEDPVWIGTILDRFHALDRFHVLDKYHVLDKCHILDKYHRTEFTTDLSKTLFFDNKLWAQVAVTILKRYLNLHFRIVTTTCPVLDDDNYNLITYKNFAKHPRRREFMYIHRILVKGEEFNTQEG